MQQIIKSNKIWQMVDFKGLGNHRDLFNSRQVK